MRALARAWSAAADGHAEEAQRALGLAREKIARANDELAATRSATTS